jgi:hypothetical protein
MFSIEENNITSVRKYISRRTIIDKESTGNSDCSLDKNGKFDCLSPVQGCSPVECLGNKRIDCLGSIDEREY